MKKIRLPPRVSLLVKRYLASEVSLRAAALAYHTILGIIPTVGLVFWYLAHLGVTEKWFQSTKGFILSQLNVDSSSQFLPYFEKLTEKVHGSSWGWIGLLLFAYTAYSLVSKFGESVDEILGTILLTEHSPRKWVILFLRRVFAMLALPVALAISLAVSQWIRKDSILHYLFQIKTFGAYFALPLAWAGSIVSAFLVYYFIPRRRIPWRQALKAACIVGPTSEFVRWAFGLYNHYAISVHKIYGVFAVVPMFVLWVQVSWTILLGGALFIQLRSQPVRSPALSKNSSGKRR